MKNTLTALIIAIATTVAPTSNAEPSPEELRSITKDVYTFTYPLVMNYRTMYMQAIDGDGEFGKWLHLDLSSPKDTDIVSPNNDTPYSYAWVDLRAEPWVLTMPKIGKERFYTSQWDDLWGYVLDNPGSVNDGNDSHSYLLASPAWKGELPKGVKRVIRGESDILGTLTRTQVVGGTQDMPRVKKIQKSYELQPLSAFTGTEAPDPAPAIDWPEWTEGDETTEKYFGYVNFILGFTTPNAADKEMYDKMAEIGVKAGVSWDQSKLKPEALEAIRNGISDARAEFKRRGEAPYDPADFFNTRKKIGTDYINRAMGVYLGIFGNTTDQSVYLTDSVDSEGNLTDGSKHAYTATFEAGNLPPVEYFWSYTMYRLPERWLVDNPLNRYSIGSSAEGLKKNKDGSLTIYFSKDSPGKDKESNWLPAPDGPFWVVLRTYGPGKEILDKSWKQPAYVPVK